MLAEKPSVAKSVSGILSSNQGLRVREGRSRYNKIFEFNYSIRGQHCQMLFTSVTGHLMELEFEDRFRKWRSCDPVDLYHAPVRKHVPEDKIDIKRTLEEEARKCQWLVLWLDCDREGENIAFEVIDVCRAANRHLTIRRARFSALNDREIHHAMQNLVDPNIWFSDAVDARQHQMMCTDFSSLDPMVVLFVSHIFYQCSSLHSALLWKGIGKYSHMSLKNFGQLTVLTNQMKGWLPSIGCHKSSVKSVERNCNVLLLEVEPKEKRTVPKLFPSKSFVHHSGEEISRKVCRSNSGLSRSQRVLGQSETTVPFSRLAFGDRRKLLETVTSQVRQKVPDFVNGPLFPRLREDVENFQKDAVLLLQRRSILLKMYRFGCDHDCTDLKATTEMPVDPTQLELSDIRRTLNRSRSYSYSLNGDDGQTHGNDRKSIGGYFRASIKQFLRKSSSINAAQANSKYNSSSSESRHAQLHDFLKSGDTIGLTLHASVVKLSPYRAWPNMHDSRFALYKLPLRVPREDQEYAGLWGGTFGWPPGRPTEDKPGKALFFLLLSYEETEGKRLLIATKILEGTHYVLHPNGSAMFVVNIDEPSMDPFPWDKDADSQPVSVEHAFMGEGIANGYGFRYPGSLFIIQNGLLAFIWKESRAVLTLQRLDLQQLLKKGERVPALPPIANFSYLTKSYSNVFAGFSNPSACSSSLSHAILDA
ncbi:hypothetical protein COLO4_35769 [Corchorus olitorius]|uniref:Toprim domain-containing protein n=1 Tax=Corchorus olitorius TaxID=93759 RepID=A0A1R3GDJ7_9ROSI|nr:hypothetical protein COLO4_35769 [Corchorus olitorius]